MGSLSTLVFTCVHCNGYQTELYTASLMWHHIDICRFSTMPELRACYVLGSWRFFLYVGALSGCSNVYHCCWLPKWLRYLSIVYQIIMMISYIIVIGVAMVDPGPGLSFETAFDRFTTLFCYIIIIFSDIVFFWQTSCGTGLCVLFQTHKTFQQDNSHRAKHQAWHDRITFTVCVLVIACEIILVGIYIWFTTNAQKMFASFIFPILNGHTTHTLMFWVYLIMQISALKFIISYILLCFLVSVDITFLFRALRKEMEGVFSVLVVDEAALERCLHTFHGICELIDAANGTFGVPLALYLIWFVLSIINLGLQLALKQKIDLIIHLSSFSYAIMIIVVILVPPSVMTAQVNAPPLLGKCYTLGW